MTSDMIDRMTNDDMSGLKDQLDKARAAQDADPMSWWNAPGFADAKRRFLDLFDLVPALNDERGERWWRSVLTLADRRSRLVEGEWERRSELLDEETSQDVLDTIERLRDYVLPMLEARVHGRNFRHSLGDDEAGSEWASQENANDDRIAGAAETVLYAFDGPATSYLHEQIGHFMNTHLSGPLVGRLWVNDLTSAAWVIVRAFYSDIERWQRY